MSASAIPDLFPEVRPNVDGAMANDRYTTRATLDWCKRVLGVEEFDLDVAACPEAHHAPRWFGDQGLCPDVSEPVSLGWINGLEQPWDAERIWCNPPYDNLGPWVHKAWQTVFRAVMDASKDLIIGMLIPDNRREQPFWQTNIEPFRDGRWMSQPRAAAHPPSILVAHDYGYRLFTHSVPGRQPFGVPGNPEGIGQQSPPFGVVLLEWRFV